MQFFYNYVCLCVPFRGASKADHLKDVKVNLSHDMLKKVSFCPNINVVQLPGESLSTDGSRGLPQGDTGVAAMEDSVELCRGSSKSDSFDSCLYADQVELPEKPVKVPLQHGTERSSPSSMHLDVHSKSATTAVLLAESDRPASESGMSLLMSCESADTKSPIGKGNQLPNSYVEKFAEFLGRSGASKCYLTIFFATCCNFATFKFLACNYFIAC